jgi:uncharacterized protein (DUF362 family)
MKKDTITMMYGTDAREMTKTLLNQVAWEHLISTDAHIVLKPNLVVPRDASEGATTHPEIVETIVSYLIARGYHRITIAESSWVGASTQDAFTLHGYDDMAKRFSVSLLDVKQDRYKTIESHGYPIEISQTILDADFLINLPVLKGHCQTQVTCALKNMKGCISDASKRKFNAWGLDEPIAALNSIRCADLVIVDSINGDLDFEEGGNPVATNRMFMGFDSVLIDTFGASLMGFELQEVPYIQFAEQFGVGSTQVARNTVIELNADATATLAKPTGKVQQLSKHTVPDAACSACYGNLIHALARMEERGTLRDLHRKVHIGQGYRGSSGCGLGVGICTKGFTHTLGGCPPKAVDIVRFLERLTDND